MCNRFRLTDKLIHPFFTLSTFSFPSKDSEKVFAFHFFWLLLFFLFQLPPTPLSAQGQLDSIALVVNYNYSTGSIKLSTGGIGVSYRYLKYKSFKEFRPFDIEVSALKHPKEERITNRTYSVSKSYVYGKLNDFFTLRISSGSELRLVEKSEPGSIGVYLASFAGISVGFQKPIYYQIIYPTGPYSFDLHDELFDVERHTTDNIYSRSSFFKGITDTKLVPGVYFKSSVCFNYGRKDNVLNRIEVGAQLEAFLRKVELMALQKNQQIFLSIFASYRIGVGTPLGQIKPE